MRISCNYGNHFTTRDDYKNKIAEWAEMRTDKYFDVSVYIPT